MDGSSRADDGPASISRGLMTCSSGRQEARGSNSASPKKQQKEYLITGGCCQPTVSEVLGWVLPALWESTRPPTPSRPQPSPRTLQPPRKREQAGRASQVSPLFALKCGFFT